MNAPSTRSMTRVCNKYTHIICGGQNGQPCEELREWALGTYIEYFANSPSPRDAEAGAKTLAARNAGRMARIPGGVESLGRANWRNAYPIVAPATVLTFGDAPPNDMPPNNRVLT